MAAIKAARSVEIAIFRFEHKAIETALNEAAKRASSHRAHRLCQPRREGSLRKLELRLLDGHHRRSHGRRPDSLSRH